MSRHGLLLPEYWGGDTGRRIAELGGKDAQLVGCYLMANHQATMIGLYPLDLLLMRALLITLSPGEIVDALDALHRAEFASYDAGTGIVWVREMAKFRLTLHVKPLQKADNRIAHVQRLYENVKPNPFLSPFFTRYRKDLHLSKRRSFQGAWKPLTKDLGRGFEAPVKPVTGTEQDQDQEDQDRRSTAADAPADLPKEAKAS